MSAVVRKNISYGHVSNSEYLKRESVMNQRIQKHCEWYTFVSGVG
jgi:hypothetical protein